MEDPFAANKADDAAVKATLAAYFGVRRASAAKEAEKRRQEEEEKRQAEEEEEEDEDEEGDDEDDDDDEDSEDDDDEEDDEDEDEDEDEEDDRGEDVVDQSPRLHGMRCTGEAAPSPRAPSPSAEVGLVYAVPAPRADAPSPAVEDLSFMWSVGVALVQSAIATAMQRVVQLQLRLERPSQVASPHAAPPAVQGKGKKTHKGKKGGHKKDKEHKRHRRPSEAGGHAGHKAAVLVGGVEGAHSTTTRRRSSSVTSAQAQANVQRRLSETHRDSIHAHPPPRRLSETHRDSINAHQSRRLSETHRDSTHAHPPRRLTENAGHGHARTHASAHANADAPRPVLLPSPRMDTEQAAGTGTGTGTGMGIGEADVSGADDLMNTIMVTTRPLSELYALFPTPSDDGEANTPPLHDHDGGAIRHSLVVVSPSDAAAALLNQPAARASTTPRNSMMAPPEGGTLRSGHVGIKLGTGRMGPGAGDSSLRGGDQSLRHRLATLKHKKSVKTMRRPPRRKIGARILGLVGVKRGQEERAGLLARHGSSNLLARHGSVKTLHKKPSKRINVLPSPAPKGLLGLEAVVEGSGDEEEDGRRSRGASNKAGGKGDRDKERGEKRGGVGDDGFYEDVVDHFMVTDPQAGLPEPLGVSMGHHGSTTLLSLEDGGSTMRTTHGGDTGQRGTTRKFLAEELDDPDTDNPSAFLTQRERNAAGGGENGEKGEKAAAVPDYRMAEGEGPIRVMDRQPSVRIVIASDDQDLTNLTTPMFNPPMGALASGPPKGPPSPKGSPKGPPSSTSPKAAPPQPSLLSGLLSGGGRGAMDTTSPQELAESVEATQKLLLQALPQPPRLLLTPKLLRRPPFGFLHALVSEIVRATGFGAKLFSTEELWNAPLDGSEPVLDCGRVTISEPEKLPDRRPDRPGRQESGELSDVLGTGQNTGSSNGSNGQPPMSTKGERIRFLVRVVAVVAFADPSNLDLLTSVSPAKVLAGAEPLQTHMLLQALAVACQLPARAVRAAERKVKEIGVVDLYSEGIRRRRSVVKLQSCVRGWLVRRRMVRMAASYASSSGTQGGGNGTQQLGESPRPVRGGKGVGAAGRRDDERSNMSRSNMSRSNMSRGDGLTQWAVAEPRSPKDGPIKAPESPSSLTQGRLPQPPPRSQASHAMHGPTHRRTTHGGGTTHGEERERRGAAAREKLRELKELRTKHQEMQEFLANKHRHQMLVEKSLRARQKAEKQLSVLMVAKGSIEEELRRTSESYKRLEESFRRAVEANRRMDDELKRQKAEQEEARRTSHLRKLQDTAHPPLIPTNAAASVAGGHAAGHGGGEGEGAEGAVVMAMDPQAAVEAAVHMTEMMAALAAQREDLSRKEQEIRNAQHRLKQKAVEELHLREWEEKLKRREERIERLAAKLRQQREKLKHAQDQAKGQAHDYEARIKVLERLSVALGNRGLLGKRAISNQLEEAVSKELSQIVGEQGSRAEGGAENGEEGEEDEEPFPKDKGEEDAGQEGQISSIFEEMIAHSDSVVDLLPALAQDQTETESMSMPLSRRNSSCGSDLLAEERRELMHLLEEEEREARERQEDERFGFIHGMVRGPQGGNRKRMPQHGTKVKQGKMRAKAKADNARRRAAHDGPAASEDSHGETEEEGEGRSDAASDGGGSYQSRRRRMGEEDTSLASQEEEEEEGGEGEGDEERSLDFIMGFCGRDGRAQDQAAQYKEALKQLWTNSQGRPQVPLMEPWVAKLYKGDKGEGGRSSTGLNPPKPSNPVSLPPASPTLPELYPPKKRKEQRPESDADEAHNADDNQSMASEASEASEASSAASLPDAHPASAALPPSVASSSSPPRPLPKHPSPHKVAKRPRLTAAQQHMHGLSGEEQEYEWALARLETFLRRRRKCLDDFMPPRPTLKLPGLITFRDLRLLLTEVNRVAEVYRVVSRRQLNLIQSLAPRKDGNYVDQRSLESAMRRAFVCLGPQSFYSMPTTTHGAHAQQQHPGSGPIHRSSPQRSQGSEEGAKPQRLPLVYDPSPPSSAPAPSPVPPSPIELADNPIHPLWDAAGGNGDSSAVPPNIDLAPRIVVLPVGHAQRPKENGMPPSAVSPGSTSNAMSSTTIDFSASPSIYLSSLTQSGGRVDELLATRLSSGGGEGALAADARKTGASICSNEMLKMQGDGRGVVGPTVALTGSLYSNKALMQNAHSLSGAHIKASSTMGGAAAAGGSLGKSKRGHKNTTRHLSAEEEEMERKMARADMGESMAWLNSFDHRFNGAVRKLDVLRDQSLLDKLKLGTDL